MIRFVFAFVVATALGVPAAAQMVVGPGDDVEGAINSLGPGDELVLRGGMYDLGSERFSFSLAGTEAQPIVIRAMDGETPHLHRPNASQNIVDIDDAEWVVIRGIEFSGGSAGLRVSGARNLTIEECEIHDSGDVALRMNDGGVLYDNVTIRRNHIHHTNNTGEGMYLGCNEDGCQLANSLIEGNYIHHTNQPSVDQGDGIELKEGSYGNVIRDNVIHDTNYPCILTYSTVGNGPPNVIERNVMWNCGDHAIQSAADSTIRNNVILSANADGIALQQHQNGAPSNQLIVHNTILLPGGSAISVRNAVGSVTIANNAVFAQSGQAIFVNGDMSMITAAGNVGSGGSAVGGYTDGALSDFVNGHYMGAPPVDAYPSGGGALVGGGDPAHVTADDFNGTPRMGVADVGAYAYSEGGNPGWTIAEGFKDGAPAPPREDAGTPPRGDAGAPPESGGDDGCGCHAAGADGRVPAAALLGLGVVVLLLRRSR